MQPLETRGGNYYAYLSKYEYFWVFPGRFFGILRPKNNKNEKFNSDFEKNNDFLSKNAMCVSHQFTKFFACGFKDS
jgi:hypothetical protein